MGSRACECGELSSTLRPDSISSLSVPMALLLVVDYSTLHPRPARGSFLVAVVPHILKGAH
jgi:hypothetical protein